MFSKEIKDSTICVTRLLQSRIFSRMNPGCSRYSMTKDFNSTSIDKGIYLNIYMKL